MTVLAQVVRSDVVESQHHGSVVALDAGGQVLLSRGTPDAVVFLRSCAKPLQATAMLEAGLGGLHGLDERHLALASASHSGEPIHVDTARELLALADVAESALQCPHDWPLSEESKHVLVQRGLEPARVQHNCSGKHSAMLATCAVNGWPLATYRDPEHPLQQAIRATIERLVGSRAEAVGVDGCGAPVHAVPLSGLARAMSALVTAQPGEPGRRVVDAMRAHPQLVGGTGRSVTRLMGAVPGLVCKDGAEAVFIAAVEDGRAVALKVDDGGQRATSPLAIAVLRAIGVAIPDEGLEDLVAPPVVGGGNPVGVIRATL